MKKTKEPRGAASSSPLSRIEHLIAAQSAEWRTLETKLSTCFVRDTISGMVISDPFLLKASLPQIEAMLAPLGEQYAQALLELKQWVAEERQNAISHFEQRIRKFAGDRALAVEGRYPSFTLAEFLSVEVISERDECLINKTVRVSSLLFDTIEPKILLIIEEDSGRRFDPASLIEELFQSWKRASAISGTGESELLPIRSVFRELVFIRQQTSFNKNPTRANFTEYRVDQFARDLSRLLESSSTVSKSGYRLDLGPTSTATDGITIRNDGAVRIVGRIGFRSGELI